MIKSLTTILIGVMTMGVALAIGFTPESQRLLQQWDGTSTRIVDELDNAFSQFITEVESFTKSEYFGEGKAINNRTGNLVQAVTGEVDGPLSGFVGTTQGTTTPYARPILGPGQTTITPKEANHLWVPVGENLTPSGVARFTPKGLYDTFGKDRINIFMSKNDNLVVFVEDPRNDDGSKARFTRKTKSGRVKGDLKGRVMFVLKDKVIIVGTDALAKGAQRMIPRGQQLFGDAIERAIPGAFGGGGTA